MTAHEQELMEQSRARLESMTEAEVAAYWAERHDADRLAKARRVRREHARHQLGLTLIWVCTVWFAFDLGYAQNRTLDHTEVWISVWSTLAMLIGGLILVGTNRHRRDQGEA